MDEEGEHPDVERYLTQQDARQEALDERGEDAYTDFARTGKRDRDMIADLFDVPRSMISDDGPEPDPYDEG